MARNISVTPRVSAPTASAAVECSSLILLKLSDKDAKKIPLIDPQPPSAKRVDTLLDKFLWPFSQSEFKSRVFRKKALAVVNAPVARFDEIINQHLFGLHLKTLLEATPSEKIFVWMRDQGKGLQLNSVELENAADALTCHRAGAALYFRAPQEFANLFCSTMSRDLGMNFAGRFPGGDVRGEIETFVSPSGHTTDWHFDFQENFTFQLQGSKRWKLKRGSISHPIRGCTPHYVVSRSTVEQQVKASRLCDSTFCHQPPAVLFDDYEEVELTAGSVLYFPAGCWHRVESTSDSISINVSLVGLTWCDIVVENLKHFLWREPSWREIYCSGGPDEGRKELATRLEQLKTNVLDKLHPEDLLPNSLFLPRRNKISLDCALDDSLDQIQLDTVFARNPLAMLIADDDCTNGAGDDQNELERGRDTDDENSDSCSSDNDQKEKTKRFFLNINFGNDDLVSAVRVELNIPFHFVPLLERLEATVEFKVSDLLKEAEVSFAQLQQLLHTLASQGYIRRLK